jgi:hypothetical protein
MPLDPTFDNTIQVFKLCDICDDKVDENDLCSLVLYGLEHPLNCHAKCVDLFYSCKGDFSILPDGNLKRAIYRSRTEQGDILIRNTGITIRDKQGRHIIKGLQISSEEGYSRINTLATIFYGLPRLENNDFYSIDEKKQIIVLRKAKEGEFSTGNLFNIKEAYRKQ